MAGRTARRRQYTRIGHRIAELGRQVALAKAIGVAPQTVSKKLRGKCPILLSDLERLARKFKLSITWFFEGYRRKDLPSDKIA